MSQRDLLLSLYNATHGESWTHNWNLSAPISLWYGVGLNSQGYVVSLSLSNNNLNGKTKSFVLNPYIFKNKDLIIILIL